MKKLSVIIISVLLGVLLQIVSFANEYTKEEKYWIDANWIEQAADGSLIANWSKTLSPTSFVITVKRDNKTVAKSVPVSGNAYDLSELVYEKGRGTYTFSVYPKKGGPSLSVTSEGFLIEGSVYTALKRCISNRQKQKVETTKVVQSIELKLQEKKVNPGAVRPVSFLDGDYYTVRAMTSNVPMENWTPGGTVTIAVTLDPKEGYSFSRSLRVSCSKAEKTTVSTDGTSAEVILTYIPYAALAQPRLLYVDANGVLFWERVEHAQRYVITVKKNGSEINRLSVTKLCADLSEYLSSAGSISLEIYSNAGSDSYNYVDSSKIFIDDLDAFLENNRLRGTFEKKGRGWQYTPFGKETVAGWKKLGQNWYYFDADGYAKKPGWFRDDDGSWYYFNANSRALSAEWLKDSDGSWYYFGNDCRMLVNQKTPDGYVVGADGRWIP